MKHRTHFHTVAAGDLPDTVNSSSQKDAWRAHRKPS